MRKRKPNEKFSAYLNTESNEKVSPTGIEISEEKLSTSTSKHFNNDDIPNKSSNNDEECLDILLKICSLIGVAAIIFISMYAIFKMTPARMEGGSWTHASPRPHIDPPFPTQGIISPDPTQINAWEKPKSSIEMKAALANSGPYIPPSSYEHFPGQIKANEMKTYPVENDVLYEHSSNLIRSATMRAPHEVRGTFYEHFIGQVPGRVQAKAVRNYPEEKDILYEHISG